MASPTLNIIPRTEAQQATSQITLCHFSTIHTELKSRSFHRECLPLAAAGEIQVRYVAPVGDQTSEAGVKFVALPRRRTRLQRLLAAPSLLRTLLAQNAEIYHFQDTELLPVAFALKLIHHKRVVYDAYEDFPSMVRGKRSIPRPLRLLAAGIVGGAERLAATCFDGLMTADPFTLRRLARRGGSRKLVFYNFPNLDFFPPPRRTQKKDFDIIYRGGLSERAGTFVLLEALRMLVDSGESPRLLLLGYCDDARGEANLLERIRALGLESSVTLQGRIGHEKMAYALSRARIGVSPLQDTPKFRLNIPVKVFEYWACGLPVIASDLPPIRPFFRNVRAGVLFRPGDVRGLSQSISWLLNHPATAMRMGQRGRAAIEQRFNNRREAQKLRQFCRSIASAL